MNTRPEHYAHIETMRAIHTAEREAGYAEQERIRAERAAAREKERS